MLPYTAFDVVVIAASQGGLQACRTLLKALPRDYPAAVIYAQHRSANAGTVLEALLSRWCALDVRTGRDGAPLTPGTVTVAPAGGHMHVGADRHVVVSPGSAGVELADELFTSAAAAYGPRALAVVLSGRMRDGTQGVRAIKDAGGRVIVQDPASADQGSMPLNALATGCVDLALEPAQIADALVTLVTVPGGAELFGVRAGSWATSAS